MLCRGKKWRANVGKKSMSLVPIAHLYACVAGGGPGGPPTWGGGGPWPPDERCCDWTSGRFFISCVKRHMWHETSWYLCVERGRTGTKHTVNQVQRDMQWADQLPQLWHWAMTFSYPLSLELNSCVPNTIQNAIVSILKWKKSLSIIWGLI